MKIDIVITTRNRAAHLEQTLRALQHIVIPDGLNAELLIVDSASTDETAQVARDAAVGHLAVRYTREDLPGQSRARNRGLAETDSEIVLFTDDDVRPSPDWLIEMSRPFTAGKAQAVAGGVRLAPHLLRAWMSRFHRAWLASSEWLDPERPQSLVGANMAFSREVLRAVPGFDPELGPGALGFGDDSLFARQLLKAGIPVAGRLDAWVEHHFEPARLARSSWLDAAQRHGRTQAYLMHHWDHRGYRFVYPRLWLARTQLAMCRARRPAPGPEGCSETELRLVTRVARFEGYLTERRRTRQYDFQGLVKRPAGRNETHSADVQRRGEFTKGDVRATGESLSSASASQHTDRRA